MNCDVRRRAWLWPLVALTATGCTEQGEADGGAFEIGGHRYTTTDFTQWALPAALREISGLTLDSRGRLFAHTDEHARIYELDYVRGGIVKHFDLGDPAARGDFEGIAWADDRLYLVTSDGQLLIAPEGEDGTTVTFQRIDTGLGSQCEIEGLHHDAAAGMLLMACKTPRRRALEGTITVLAWSLDAAAPVPASTLSLPLTSGVVHPSGISRAPNGKLLLVAARQHALVEVGMEGTSARAIVLPDEQRHPQMEGIAITDRGDLIISDEGGTGRARLGIYHVRE